MEPRLAHHLHLNSMCIRTVWAMSSEKHGWDSVTALFLASAANGQSKASQGVLPAGEDGKMRERGGGRGRGEGGGRRRGGGGTRQGGKKRKRGLREQAWNGQKHTCSFALAAWRLVAP